MTQKRKVIIFAILAAIVIGIAAFYYVMYGGARDLTTEKTEFVVSSAAIVNEFTQNQSEANKKYLEKAVAVKGIVSQAEGIQIILDSKVNCSFKTPDPSIKVGQSVTVKGRVVGYDDLMEELKMDECFISNE